jgi:nucleotide-binding universal stress UspA family protein
MYQRILVPIDGSATSLTGLEHALGLARDQQASVRILNVIDERVLATMMVEPVAVPIDDLLDSMRAEGRKVLDNAQARAQAAGVAAEAVQVASRGSAVSDVILAQAKRAKADVIVMGTHGRRGLNRLLLGSDAERVLRDARVPVLLVRRPERRRAAPRKKSGTASAARKRAGAPRT